MRFLVYMMLLTASLKGHAKPGSERWYQEQIAEKLRGKMEVKRFHLRDVK